MENKEYMLFSKTQTKSTTDPRFAELKTKKKKPPITPRRNPPGKRLSPQRNNPGMSTQCSEEQTDASPVSPTGEADLAIGEIQLDQEANILPPTPPRRLGGVPAEKYYTAPTIRQLCRPEPGKNNYSVGHHFVSLVCKMRVFKGHIINYGSRGSTESVGGITQFWDLILGGSLNSRSHLWGGSTNHHHGEIIK